MPKLHLKRTPEEEAQHRLRKEKKKEEKRKRKHHRYDNSDDTASRKRHHPDVTHEPKWASSDSESDYGPQPAPKASSATSSSTHYRAHKPDYDAILADLEEQKFREKMFDALGDDERLDSVEARLNDLAHVPDRWRSGGSTSSKHRGRVYEDEDDLLKVDPQNLDEEEYAEWIRAGMYRKTHAEEYAEQQRKKAERAARKAEEKARRAEAAKLEKEAEEERQRKKRERDSRKWDYAREEYHSRWKSLLMLNGDGGGEELRFDDIPWPVVSVHRQKPDKKRSSKHGSAGDSRMTVEDLTEEAVAAFILPVVSGEEQQKKERKERLRETFLRFHPDKFEGRFMKRVHRDDREKVRLAIGQVSRILNGLMG